MVTVFAVIAAVFILATVSDIVATASCTPQLQAEWQCRSLRFATAISVSANLLTASTATSAVESTITATAEWACSHNSSSDSG